MSIDVVLQSIRTTRKPWEAEHLFYTEEMIFYDETHKRRYVFWLISFLLSLIVLAALSYSYRVLTHTYQSDLPVTTSNLAATAIDKRVVLTFDDGPSPQYTDQILNILIEKHVPAVFFFVGERMVEYPDIVARVYDAGFEIGNHTYSHSDHVHRSPERIQRELLTTNKLIAQYTGHRSILYRPPYLLDLNNETPELITGPGTATTSRPIATASELGFIVVGTHVDSDDWNASGPSTIISEVLDTLPDGHLILLHDGGGDRSATVSALPILIDEMRQQGYQFVSLAETLGLTRDDVMPSAYPQTTGAQIERVVVSSFIAGLDHIVPWLLLILIFLVVWRAVFISVFSLMPHFGRAPRPWRHGVSIVIPAHNEAQNIAGTIRSVRDATSGPHEIFIVDDGSTDDTVAIARRTALECGGDIFCLRKENAGKASALNAALPFIKYDVMITMDGDSVIASEALSYLTAHFNDNTIGAVGGKVVVVPRPNPLSLIQDLEYTVGQNVEKRAFGRLGAIGVVPGALGAWRTRSVREVGGFSTDTLVEDQDLTYALHTKGLRVIYEPRARVFTEVPASTASFFKQRLRWMFGTMQCLWKYRHWTFSVSRPAFGFVLLPYMLTYSFVVPLLWPFAIMLAIASMLFVGWSVIVAALILFFTIDAFYTLLGLIMEPKKLWLILLLPWQRIYYRIIFSVIILVCGLRIFQGTRAYWQKLKRTGSAQRYYQTKKAATLFAKQVPAASD